MARKNLNEISEDVSVESLAAEYIEAKKEELSIKKVTSDLNSKLKKLFKDNEIDSLDTPLGRLVLTERVSESFYEESLIDFLKTSGNAKGIVQTKEYVDYDALESAIYREKIDIDTVKKLNDFKIKKVTPTLTIK